eukprot:1539227-Lingulodinium_polyedra.AAC.1
MQHKRSQYAQTFCDGPRQEPRAPRSLQRRMAEQFAAQISVRDCCVAVATRVVHSRAAARAQVLSA